MNNPEVVLIPKSVSVRCTATGPDVYAPGRVGELTQIIDPVLVDAVIEETAAREQRLRLLPARVVVYFVLALAFFEQSSYQGGGSLTGPAPEWKTRRSSRRGGDDRRSPAGGTRPYRITLKAYGPAVSTKALRLSG